MTDLFNDYTPIRAHQHARAHTAQKPEHLVHQFADNEEQLPVAQHPPVEFRWCEFRKQIMKVRSVTQVYNAPGSPIPNYTPHVHKL